MEGGEYPGGSRASCFIFNLLRVSLYDDIITLKVKLSIFSTKKEYSGH